MNTRDYALTLRDDAGRIAIVPINGDSIDEHMRDGRTFEDAREIVEGNATQKAVARGEIGDHGVEVWIDERIAD